MPELFPKDIEAIAKAAFESHTKDKWDDVDGTVRAAWLDKVPDAIRGRGSNDGVPAIEQAIVNAWKVHPVEGAEVVPVVVAPAPLPAPKPKAEAPSKLKTK